MIKNLLATYIMIIGVIAVGSLSALMIPTIVEYLDDLYFRLVMKFDFLPIDIRVGLAILLSVVLGVSLLFITMLLVVMIWA